MTLRMLLSFPGTPNPRLPESTSELPYQYPSGVAPLRCAGRRPSATCSCSAGSSASVGCRAVGSATRGSGCRCGPESWSASKAVGESRRVSGRRPPLALPPATGQPATSRSDRATANSRPGSVDGRCRPGRYRGCSGAPARPAPAGRLERRLPAADRPRFPPPPLPAATSASAPSRDRRCAPRYAAGCRCWNCAGRRGSRPDSPTGSRLRSRGDSRGGSHSGSRPAPTNPSDTSRRARTGSRSGRGRS